MPPVTPAATVHPMTQVTCKRDATTSRRRVVRRIRCHRRSRVLRRRRMLRLTRSFSSTKSKSLSSSNNEPTVHGPACLDPALAFFALSRASHKFAPSSRLCVFESPELQLVIASATWSGCVDLLAIISGSGTPLSCDMVGHFNVQTALFCRHGVHFVSHCLITLPIGQIVISLCDTT